MTPIAERRIADDAESWHVRVYVPRDELTPDEAETLLTALTHVAVEPNRCLNSGCNRFCENGFNECTPCLAAADAWDDGQISSERGA